MSVCVFLIEKAPIFQKYFSDKIRNQIIPTSFLPFIAKSFVLSVKEKTYRIHSSRPLPPSLLTQTKCKMVVILCFGRFYKSKFSLPLPEDIWGEHFPFR